jgi:hypothetical protein
VVTNQRAGRRAVWRRDIGKALWPWTSIGRAWFRLGNTRSWRRYLSSYRMMSRARGISWVREVRRATNSRPKALFESLRSDPIALGRRYPSRHGRPRRLAYVGGRAFDDQRSLIRIQPGSQHHFPPLESLNNQAAVNPLLGSNRKSEAHRFSHWSKKWNPCLLMGSRVRVPPRSPFIEANSISYRLRRRAARPGNRVWDGYGTGDI